LPGGPKRREWRGTHTSILIPKIECSALVGRAADIAHLDDAVPVEGAGSIRENGKTSWWSAARWIGRQIGRSRLSHAKRNPHFVPQRNGQGRR
jgi:hypothetical protein